VTDKKEDVKQDIISDPVEPKKVEQVDEPMADASDIQPKQTDT